MTTRTRNFKLFVLLLADSALLVAALSGACLLRFGLSISSDHALQMMVLAPVMVPAQVGLFALFGLYRGLWRRTGSFDLWRLARACFVSMLLASTCAFLFRLNLSRPVLIIDAILGFLLASTLRVGIRTLCEVRTNPEGLEAYGLLDTKIRTCPLCGQESKRADRPPPERALGCIYPIH